MIFVTRKTKTKKIQKDQNVSEWNYGWKTGMAKVHLLTYFQNLYLNECYTMLLIIHWFLYIDYFIHVILLILI